MKYTNEKVRRQDRLLEEEKARRLLEKGEYGVLSLVKEEGGAYGLPVNFVWDGDDAIYIHCAPVGHKLRCIAHCAAASFCIVGATTVVPDKFTTAYESVVVDCQAQVGLSPVERIHALELLLMKYAPDYRIVGKQQAEKSFGRTEIIRLNIRAVSGKCKRMSYKS